MDNVYLRSDLPTELADTFRFEDVEDVSLLMSWVYNEWRYEWWADDWTLPNETLRAEAGDSRNNRVCVLSGVNRAAATRYCTNPDSAPPGAKKYLAKIAVSASLHGRLVNVAKLYDDIVQFNTDKTLLTTAIESQGELEASVILDGDERCTKLTTKARQAELDALRKQRELAHQAG